MRKAIVFFWMALLLSMPIQTDSQPLPSLSATQSVSPAVLPDQQQQQQKETELQVKPVQNIANNWLRRPELQHSLVGLEVMHIPTGHVMFSFNGRRRLTPASIAKIFTTACAIDLLGPDYKYRTQLIAGGQISGSKLNGSLLIVPSQDPSFKREDVRKLLSVLSDQGVNTIAGRLMVGTVGGGGELFSTEWLAQDWGQDWMPVSSDLVIDRNIASKDPGLGFPLIQHTYESEPNGLLKSLLKSPWAPAWVEYNKINSTVDYYKPEVQTFGGLVVANPSDYNQALVRQTLRHMGIKVVGAEAPIGDDAKVIAEHYSKPLSSIAQFTLKESDNLYAQQLLRTIGSLPPINKAVEKASLEERGIARLHHWLYQIGASPNEVVLFDGCGLSRKDVLSAHALNLVLKHMVGKNGTGMYADLLTHDGEGPTKTWRYKTGAMDSVRSISGVIKTAAGEPLAVTAIINAHTPSVRELRVSLRSLIDQLQNLGPLTFAPEPVETPKKTVAKKTVSSVRKKPVRRSTSRRARRHR
jgi:serine-type D-Ala-D-Ala carboxypeptidase/endopeptidase (penicillin-binding protein 4)